MERSIADYTGEAFEGYDHDDVAGLLKNRLKQGREKLEETREAVKALCEPVEPPRDTAAYLHYFCAADSGNAEQLKDNEAKRLALYKLAAAFLRAFANVANEMDAAGYSKVEAETIKDEVAHFENVRSEVKLASGDYIDLKMYEPAMRHLLDAYIRAEDSEKVSALDDLPLVRLILERGERSLDSLPDGIRKSEEATAETIENNVRRLIIDEMAVNPKYYEEMSALLDALIVERKRQALDYKEHLAKVIALAKRVGRVDEDRYPLTINNSARRALFDNLRDWPGLDSLVSASHVTDTDATVAETAALRVDAAIRAAKRDDWRGNRFKEREVLNAIKSVLPDDDLANRLFEIVKAQHDY